MTKKDAAIQALGVARAIHGTLAGDEGADVWVLQLLWLAEGLDPSISQHDAYVECLGEGDLVPTKLRRLIEHPSTPTAEREAAVAALARIRSAS